MYWEDVPKVARLDVHPSIQGGRDRSHATACFTLPS